MVFGFTACLLASAVADAQAGFERVCRLFLHVVPGTVAVHVGIRPRWCVQEGGRG